MSSSLEPDPDPDPGAGGGRSRSPGPPPASSPTNRAAQDAQDPAQDMAVHTLPLSSPIAVPTRGSHPEGKSSLAELAARMGRPARRSSSPGALDGSARSECRVVRRNSLRFKHGDPDGDDSSSGSSGSGSKMNLEVMDLRDSAHARNLFSMTSNLNLETASVSSAFTLDSAAAQGLTIREAMHGVDGLDNRGSLATAPLYRTDSEQEQAYLALMRMMKGGSDHGDEDSDDTVGGGYPRSVCSRKSTNTGFWSALGHRRSSSGGSSEILSADGSAGSEPSEGKRRPRRKLNVRKCARTVSVFVVLAALSCYAISVSVGFHHLLDGLFGRGVAEEQEGDQRLLPQDQGSEESKAAELAQRAEKRAKRDHRVQARKELDERQREDDLLLLQRIQGGEKLTAKQLARRAKNLRHRNKRLHAREEASRARARRERKEHQERAARRRAMQVDGGHDEKVAGGDAVDERWLLPLEEHHQGYERDPNGHSFVEEGQRGLLHEDSVQAYTTDEGWNRN